MDNNKLTNLTESKSSRSYLVTYRKLDHKRFPTRWSFGMAVVGAFGGNAVDYFVVGKEEREEPCSYDYYAAIRLNRATRREFAKRFPKENVKIIVHYGVSGDMYEWGIPVCDKVRQAPLHWARTYKNIQI